MCHYGTEEKRSFAMNGNKNWYVVYTRPRAEKKVALLLEDMGIEHYCPVIKAVRQWSDRKKVILEPLFKGYVFVKVEPSKRWEVTKVPGVLNYVYYLGSTAVVRQEEIDNIQRFLREFDQVKVENILQTRDLVEIQQGILMNYKGIVLEVTGKRVKVLVRSLGMQLTAVFAPEDLKVLENHYEMTMG